MAFEVKNTAHNDSLFGLDVEPTQGQTIVALIFCEAGI